MKIKDLIAFTLTQPKDQFRDSVILANLERAWEIIEAYYIALDEMGHKESSETRIETLDIPYTERTRMWLSMLCDFIAPKARCISVFSTENEYCLFGMEEDIELGKLLITYVYDYLKRGCRELHRMMKRGRMDGSTIQKLCDDCCECFVLRLGSGYMHHQADYYNLIGTSYLGNLQVPFQVRKEWDELLEEMGSGIEIADEEAWCEYSEEEEDDIEIEVE